MNAGSQINYKQLLERHERIQIPRIQRDYVQGRSTAAEVREEFLNALEQALRKPSSDPTLPLNLDFVYGSVEGDNQTHFLPLDGQQRLTTLFLLHWYLAWRDEQWGLFKQMFLTNGQARFTYSVRPSSSEFFDALTNYHPTSSPESVIALAKLIEDQPWYFRSWRLDPTIQSVLGMLDALHRRFALSSGLFHRLIDDERPAITFQLLDLKNFGLSDDLYIKMNARGKPLTPFETFKARYEQELQGQFVTETFSIGQADFPVADYVARRMDTTWADLFWKLRDPKTNFYDNALMNVFRAVAITTRDPDSASYLEDFIKLRFAAKPPSYTDFHQYKWLDERFTLTLIYLLDAWSAESGKLSTLLPNGRYFDETAFFQKVVTTGINLPYAELVQFTAYAMFIAKHHDKVDPGAFQEWMRIVYNLSVNSDYNRPDDFRRSVVGLNQMLRHSQDLLKHFAGTKDPISGFSEPQIAEEKLKAELMLANNEWKPLIDQAEEHGYFRGQIGFLLDFCGAISAKFMSEVMTWTVESHVVLQSAFRHHLHWSELMFTADGLSVNITQYRWQRALLSIGNYLLPKGRNFSFLVNPSADEASWKRLLRGAGTNRTILKSLWEQLSPDVPIVSQLDTIIQNSQVSELWRAALVHCPEAFDYCANKCLRWDAADIYLLKRHQMNGTHAELFTYCLYSQLKREKKLLSFLQYSYESAIDTYSEPYIGLRRVLVDKQLNFYIEFQRGQYRIRYDKDLGDLIPDFKDQLKDVVFEDDGFLFYMCSNLSNIESVLKTLDQMLKTHFTNTINHA